MLNDVVERAGDQQNNSYGGLAFNAIVLRVARPVRACMLMRLKPGLQHGEGLDSPIGQLVQQYVLLYMDLTNRIDRLLIVRNPGMPLVN